MWIFLGVPVRQRTAVVWGGAQHSGAGSFGRLGSTCGQYTSAQFALVGLRGSDPPPLSHRQRQHGTTTNQQQHNNTQKRLSKYGK